MKNLLLDVFDFLNLLFTKFGAFTKSPSICAISWNISLFRFNLKTRIKKKNILVLYRSFGIEDFTYLSEKEKKKISIFIFPRKQIKIIFEVFFKGTNHHLNDNNYTTNNKQLENTKLLYRKFLIKILKKVNKDYNFSSIVSFNFRYYAERELHYAASTNFIKFICLHKESLIFPGEISSYKKVLKNYGKYGGKNILVYNDYFNKVISSAGIINKKRIQTIGMPRADFYFKSNNSTYKKKKNFLILLINTKRNIKWLNKIDKRQIKIDKKKIIWDNLSKIMIRNVLKFAQTNPNINFIFKSKSKIVDKNFLKKVGLDQIYKNQKLSNCKLVFKDNTTQLIKESDLIIGFNSTALIESLLANKQVIVPKFFINDQSIIKNFTLNLNNLAYNANTEKEFQILMNKAKFNKLKKPNSRKYKVKKVAKFYLGNTDGKSTKRLLNYI